ncbi:Leucyl aminopeptidase [Gluconacetobacter diazotrophicus PA1 5]|uniref:Leucyl aminopeptidase family protein n=2 Tax=Gluconacetobacter diazotrophicus TaxID=33996 RepID=A0A7W4I4R8_GLUDI|nr:leucyl aminopeptidase family protein [Gluconacetobacter diazotrophicus]ACI50049.1 Leucyl aminopeptidase [Gluconacetobacter diazotrophicus PA1 5]MBB2156257.1 leucyl aminopeptidase family protein [Gluconacetobacter diazotrophicus]TWB07871.1 leucyl aminopeptidase [Gluconacetobacter diazotrophicus]CAP55971.1 putative cytosol aminopeptidase [Gluconacetobacter diazotrophicus PA1 5]
MSIEEFPCLLPPTRGRRAGVRTIHALPQAELGTLGERIGATGAAFARDTGFQARPGELALIPGANGVAAAVLGVRTGADGGAADPFQFGGLAGSLPPGAWKIALPDGVAPATAVLGFCLGAYRMPAFGRAEASPPGKDIARLIVPAGGGAGAEVAHAIRLGRDLINTPPNLMGPAELARAARHMLNPLGARVETVKGRDLARAYPTIAHVGAGSARAPKVVIARWQGSAAGPDAPLLSLVGKGVCFDTGGYDLKQPSGMLRMKKDMGGAAVMLSLAHLILTRDLPIRLELRLGCVENSVSGEAMRPSDVVVTRSGLTVEIGNTDAEGRLVLCDLLTDACAAAPDLLIDAATLTGAARVALGPDLPALFSPDDAVAQAILEAGTAQCDPLWRLPLWDGYADWLRSPVADLNNVSAKPMAGSVTAALFLRNFVKTDVRWAHIDLYGWNDHYKPGRPEGGETPILRAVYASLLRILNVADRVSH